jgi:class 3 adenylate cyclase
MSRGKRSESTATVANRPLAAIRDWSVFVLLCIAREGTMAETRKLAAILCSDVVGYSRLARRG